MGSMAGKPPSFSRQPSRVAVTVGPKSRAWQINGMPTAAFDDRYQLCNGEDKPLARRDREAVRGDGTVIKGTSDADGYIELQRGDTPARLKFRHLFLKPDPGRERHGI